MAPHAEAPSFPLHVSEVLEEELEKLLPPSQDAERPASGAAGRSRWDLSAGQIRLESLPGLLARLRRPGDEVCARLSERLSAEFRELVDRQGEDGGPSEEDLRGALAEQLNRCLRDESLYSELREACRRDKVRLSDEMARLLAQPPADHQRLNRLLLEEALPGVFEPVLEERMAAVYRQIHRHPQGLAALCLSGGGIRSAVFSLGVVQGLARRGLLHGFDYLSTVSGGGYFGGLLSAWIHRHPGGIDGVSADLAGATQSCGRLDPEPGPLAYLRSFSNYLSPRLGILSADSWTLVSIYARNLYLNWLVSIPLLLALLAMPRLYAALVVQTPKLVELGTPLWTDHKAWLLPDLFFVLGSLLLTGALGYIGWNRPSGGRRSTTRGFLWLCLLPLTLAAVLITIYWAWYRGLHRPFPGWLWFLGPAVSINLTGWSIHAVPALMSGRTRPLAKLREIPFLILAGMVGGGVTGLVAKLVFLRPRTSTTLFWFVILAVPTIIVSFILGETLFAGLASRWTDDEDREWWSRSAAWMLIVVGVWTSVTAIVILGPAVLADWQKILAPLGGLAGVATWLLARSSMTHASTAKGQAEKGGLSGRLTDLGLGVAAPVFVLFLMSALSLAMSSMISAWGLRTAAPATLRTALKVQLLTHATGEALSRWHFLAVRWASLPGVALIFLATLAIGLFMALLIDINKFSLHGMYRNRLVRAFLGASRENRSPNVFTGFDAEDNLEIWRLRLPLFLRRKNLEPGAARLCLRLKDCKRPPSEEIVQRHLSTATRRQLAEYRFPDPPPSCLVDALVADFNRLIRSRFDDALLRGLQASPAEIDLLRRARSDDERLRRQRDLLLRAFQEEIDVSVPPKPLHVVNVALNLVAGKKLAWQQRKAETFTFSPLHCGSARLGYRPSDGYARGGLNRRAVSLGTAMAISGAAASPNMGYHSSPAITFLMTFFNARLGWWLGNPGVAGARTFDRGHPTLAVGPLVSEAFGLTDDANPYVYLSDGGHFENLGLYEMVLRRCRHVVVIDAGQDRDCLFEDLGNAIRKIRIDLGVPIDLHGVRIRGEAENGRPPRYCAVGKILYSAVDGDGAQDGTILYLKPTICGGEPADVLHYKALNNAFPHESTGDQWFSESQFESYRMLGAHAIDEICRAAAQEGVADLEGLFASARRYLGDLPAAQAPPVLAEVVAATEAPKGPVPEQATEENAA
jgi:hypothetical protein